jgi:hypothetical protein
MQDCIENDLTITVYRGSEPVLITGDASVVGAVVRALVGVLEQRSDRPVLHLARELKPEEAP